MFEALVAAAVLLFFGLIAYFVYLMGGIDKRNR
jgi:hypothetical protein